MLFFRTSPKDSISFLIVRASPRAFIKFTLLESYLSKKCFLYHHSRSPCLASKISRIEVVYIWTFN
jgi:hypothetical protein